ncbi:unnamed protein product [Chondrus crispus]|uniref:Uncharacterized protein n=1 Tax=Chondrus crispus TaxID=2769 RepID=R7QKI8_CHOCR|nr:unnamed protein product [Chondrus crispus]CDF37920.1 unnamed protein product [Chondrus crispus]|eukprot:XP_005717791.1 unnamed protein product [Chondrus crispus]
MVEVLPVPFLPQHTSAISSNPGSHRSSSCILTSTDTLQNRSRFLVNVTTSQNMSSAGSSKEAGGSGEKREKRRRGRQPRQSLVSPTMHQSISQFANVIGGPVFVPAGFRDYSGWLSTISGPRYQLAWSNLVRAFTQECATVEQKTIPQLKRDVVTDIVNMVVDKRPHESAKLVSTNARRQCETRPSGGISVMTIFEKHLLAQQEVRPILPKAPKRGGAASPPRGSASTGSPKRTSVTTPRSGIPISSLLVESRHPNPGGSKAPRSPTSTRLPPIADFDAQVQEIKKRDRDRRR